MKARVKLAEGMTFVAESGSGHAVVVDASAEVGGRNLGARPMELVLMGTGACTAIDVLLILRKARGTLIIADNVVRNGAVIDANSTDPRVLGVRRFNELLAADPGISATIIQTVGTKGYDGFAFAVVV